MGTSARGGPEVRRYSDQKNKRYQKNTRRRENLIGYCSSCNRVTRGGGRSKSASVGRLASSVDLCALDLRWRQVAGRWPAPFFVFQALLRFFFTVLPEERSEPAA